MVTQLQGMLQVIYILHTQSIYEVERVVSWKIVIVFFPSLLLGFDLLPTYPFALSSFSVVETVESQNHYRNWNQSETFFFLVSVQPSERPGCALMFSKNETLTKKIVLDHTAQYVHARTIHYKKGKDRRNLHIPVS